MGLPRYRPIVSRLLSLDSWPTLDASLPLVASVPASSSLAIALRIFLAVLAGALATLAMDVVMARIEKGKTPPRVASGVLTETRPDEAPRRLAAVVHYVAGALSGPLYAWVLLLAEGLLGPGLPAALAATVVFYPLMVGFFVFVVLPRSRGVSRERRRAIGRAWALEAAAYLAVLVPLVVASVVV
jgi:hypothetical protein